MASVPREVLKWVQSLDLAYSVKNPKRDFSNGFLIAEIFSRYYPRDIEMHCFDAGLNSTKKFSNWELLDKFFKKNQIPLSRTDWEPVVYCAPDAVVKVLKNIYTFLTNKQIGTPPVQPRRYDKAASQKAPPPDQTAPPHSLFVDEETPREQDATSEGKPAMRMIPRGSARQLQKGSNRELQGIEIREVEIKPIHKSVVQIRATKSMSMQKSSQEQSVAGSLRQSDSPPKNQTGMDLGFNMAKPVSEICGDSLFESLNAVQKSYADIGVVNEEHEDSVRFFFRNLENIAPDLSSTFFENLNRKLYLITDLVSKSPHEFWVLSSLLLPAIERLPVNSDHYLQLMETFSLIAERLASADASRAEKLLNEYLLPKIAKLSVTHPGKREVLCHLFYSFILPSPAARLRAIQNLSRFLPGYHELVKCLAVLIKYDKEYNEELHDVFIYYALLGLEHPSPSVRTPALAIFSHIATLNHLVIVNVVALLNRLTEDPWWEVKAQVVQCAGTLLSMLDPQQEDSNVQETIHSLKEVVHKVLTPTAIKNVLRVGLVYVAPALHKHPDLAYRYVECLLEVPVDMRKSLLEVQEDPESNMEEGVFVLGVNTQRYKMGGCPALWNSPAIARNLADSVKNHELENLEEPHIEVLQACLTNDLTPKEAWVDVFQKLQEYLCVALCDPDLCVRSMDILYTFLTHANVCENTLLASREIMIKAINLVLSNNPDPICIQTTLDLLKKLFNESGVKQAQEYVKLVVKLFKEKYPELYESTPIKALSEELLI